VRGAYGRNGQLGGEREEENASRVSAVPSSSVTMNFNLSVILETSISIALVMIVVSVLKIRYQHIYQYTRSISDGGMCMPRELQTSGDTCF
jgi:hypothetical protein